MNKDKDKITEIQEDFQLKYEINKWEQKINNTTGKPEIIFEVDVFSEISKKKWSVYHTLDDFQNFIYNISSICLNIPEFNGFQNLAKDQSSSKISDALQNFTDYLKNISYRGDIVNSRYFINFFGLQNHFENLDKFEPKPILHIDNLKYEVTDIVYLDAINILIIACATEIERSTFESLKFWKKKERGGEILIYKLNKFDLKDNNNINNKESYTLINSIKTTSEVNLLFHFQDSNILIAGYFDGYIEIFQISDDKSETSTQVISSSMKILVSPSKNKLMNIGFNPNTNYIYTACYKEKVIGVSFLHSKNMIKNFQGGDAELAGFSYMYKNNIVTDIVITLDINGRLIIGTIKNDNKDMNIIFESINQLTDISLFKVNWNYNHIYIGDKNGEIDMFDFEIEENDIKVRRIFTASLTKDDSTKKKFAKILFGNYPFKIQDIEYNPNKKEILIALHNGTIQIYSHFKNFPECVLYENIKYLNKLLFNKNKSILFTGGVEKDVYGYYIPSYYCTEMSRKIQNANLYNFMNDVKIVKNHVKKNSNNEKDNKINNEDKK
jgi:hypothetical protein